MRFNLPKVPAPIASKLRWYLLLLAAVSLIFFAIVMSVLRLALPYLNEYEQHVESYLSETVGRQVSIDKIDADWYWLSPRLKLQEIVIKNNDNTTQYMRFDEIIFEFGIFTNLFNLSFEATKISLIGGYFIVERDLDGNFKLQKQSLLMPTIGQQSGTDSNNVSLLEKLNNKEIRVLDSTIRWSDAVNGISSSVFKELNSIVKINDETIQFLLDTDSPNSLAQQVLIKTEFNKKQFLKGDFQFYLNAKGLMTDFLSRYLPEMGVTVNSLINSELWLNFEKGNFVKSSGFLSAEKLSLSSAKEQTWLANNLSLQFVLSNSNDHWRLSFDRLNMAIEERVWSDVYLSFDYNIKTDAMALRSDYLDIANVSALILSLPVNEKTKNSIKKYKPVGELRKIDISVKDWQAPDTWMFKSAFTKFGITLEAEKILLSGLDGQLSVEKNKTKLKLDSQDVVFVSEYFNQSLSLETITGDIDVIRNIDGLSLQTNNLIGTIDGVTLYSRLKFSEIESNFIDMQLSAEKATMQWLNKHRSDYLLGKELSNWLSDSVKIAQLSDFKLLLHGPLNDFPFTNKVGVFESEIKFADAGLKYAPDWPQINNINASLEYADNVVVIAANNGNIYDTEIETSTTTLTLNKLTQVTVDSSFTTTTTDLDKFFTATPLKQDYLSMVESVEINGTVDVNLLLNFQLETDDDIDVSGKAVLKKANLKVKDSSYYLSDIDGVVDFKNNNIASSKLTARFKNKPVLATVVTHSSRSGDVTEISAAFTASIENLLPATLNLSSAYRAQPEWLLDLRFAHKNNQLEAPLSMALVGDFTHVDVLLPEPFKKPKGKKASLMINVDWLDKKTQMRLRYDEKLKANLSWLEDLSTLQADVRLLDGAPNVNATGVNVSARLDSLDLKKWQSAITPLLPRNKNTEPVFNIDRLLLKTQQLFYDKFTINNVKLLGSANDEVKFNLNSDEFIGDIQFKRDFDIDTAINISFTKLDLTKFSADKTDDDKQDLIQANKIPPLRIKGKNIIYPPYRFSTMSLETSRSSYGLTVHALDLQADSLALKLKGNWFLKKASKDQSSFRIEIDSRDVGRLLQRFDISQSLREGKANAVIDWQWQGSPFDFDWKNVSGNMKLSAKEGRFIDIEPGAGRLLGMFSLSALPERFTLDFSDTFEKGFKFSELNSVASFSGGSMYTKQTEINGSSVDIYMQGRIGLSDKDFDQYMSVVPRLSSGISGWVTVLQGAAIGLTAYVGQKLLGVDDAAKNQYHITGSWKEPVITKVSEKSVPKSTSQ